MSRRLIASVVLVGMLPAVLALDAVAAKLVPPIPAGKYQGTARKSKSGGTGGTYQFGFTVVGSRITGITFSKIPMTCVSSTSTATKLVTLPRPFPSAKIFNGFLLPVIVYTGGHWKLIDSSQATGLTPTVSFNLAYDYRPKHFAASVGAADLNVTAKVDADGKFDPNGPFGCTAASDVTLTKR